MQNYFFRQSMPKISLTVLLAAALAFLAGCGGGGAGGGTTDTTSTTTTATATVTAASLSLSATPTTVKSDNSTTTTVTVMALTASNAPVPAVVVTLSADTGILSAATVTTDSAGQATFTFRSGTSSKSNRTATITATAGTVTTQLPVQIVDSTLVANPNSGITVPNDGTSPATVTFTAKDAGGNVVPGAAVTLSSAGVGAVTITPVTAPAGFTDASGQYVVSVAGGAATGAVTVTGNAVGATASATINVNAVASTFAISGLSLNGAALTGAATNNFSATAMTTADALVVIVAAPAPTANVTFATTMGSWNGGGTAVTVSSAGGVTCGAVTTVAGTACATLTTLVAGLANIQVVDPVSAAKSDTLTVSMTATTAAAITLQAAPGVVPKSVGTTTGTSTLIATVKDAAGLPVGGAPVAFSILNPTGGGENVSPVVAYTAATATAGLALGQAITTFTAGSLSSGATGIQVRAQVLGTGVVTEGSGINLTASGNDAAVIIGGTAGSVAFGQATALTVGGNGTAYILPMSVLVADSNGNPAPQGTVVNISAWPIAWSTGTGCTADPDAPLAVPPTGTFLNEDVSENLVLDAGEDGNRTYYVGGGTVVGGRIDAALTPPNSASGALTSTRTADATGTVTTDANGLGTFNLTYTKTSAIWTVVRVRASTVVQGTSAVGEVQFRLAPLKADVDPDCLLPNSPYSF